MQDEIIQSVLDGNDTLALLPTGGGKSICFQVPALMQEGVCLVISPLIALMKDQVQNLNKRNIPAVAIYSGMHYRLNIAEIRKWLPDAPILALTATATPKVVEDIQEKLEFRKGKKVFQKSFARDNLSYVVFEEEGKQEKMGHRICA